MYKGGLPSNLGNFIHNNVLTKASGYSVFIDLDWTNSFHQIPISEKTSNRLSFVPEGVGPASGIPTLNKLTVEVTSLMYVGYLSLIHFSKCRNFLQY
jgi:hypothetical protein